MKCGQRSVLVFEEVLSLILLFVPHTQPFNACSVAKNSDLGAALSDPHKPCTEVLALVLSELSFDPIKFNDLNPPY